MKELTKAITAGLAKMPEGTPVTTAEFLHLADRVTVSRTLCALKKSGEVFRVSRGVYVATILSRFGRQGRWVHIFIEQLAKKKIRRPCCALWSDLRQQIWLDYSSSCNSCGRRVRGLRWRNSQCIRLCAVADWLKRKAE